VFAVRLTRSDINMLVLGCAAVGAGGGGDPHLGGVMAQLAIDQHGPVEVVALEDLPPDTLVLPCGAVGAPGLADERIWSGREGRTLVEAAEDLHGRRVGALMPYEIAGANGVLPVTWAAETGLPLVDADGMGRTFPRLDQQAMSLAGVAAGPVVLTDGRGNTLVLHPADDRWADRLARGAAVSLGGVCAGAMYAMTAERAQPAVIAGSLSRALSAGVLMAARGRDRVVDALCEALEATVLVEGRVIALERDVGEDRSVRGTATVQGVAGHAGRQMRLETQNEFLMVLEYGAVAATVPDLITVLATDTGDIVRAERLRHGQHVVVLASPGPAVWRSEEALDRVGPAAFGYDVAFTPIAAARVAG
jgi:DUF917 family protein